MRISLDAMGGDYAPKAIVEGASLAFEEIESSLVLVGKEEEIRMHLSKLDSGMDSRVEIINSRDVIGMTDSISKAIRKSDSSIRVAADTVKEGYADALVSMGHSGAFIAMSIITLGKIDGVDRPALAALIPTLKGFSVLIDVGANVDSKPLNLIQFAVMGKALARVAFNKEELKVGLLSNGEEDIKGNVATKKAHSALKTSMADYVGYVEGKDILTGEADVIVCDGFVGNVVLKMGEGFVEVLPRFIMKKILQKGENRSDQSSFGYLPSLDEFDGIIRENFDYNEYGGALLLGINGLCILGHGRSQAKAVKNAIRMAERFVKSDLVSNIREEISNFGTK